MSLHGTMLRQFDKCLAKDQLLPLLKGDPGTERYSVGPSHGYVQGLGFKGSPT